MRNAECKQDLLKLICWRVNSACGCESMFNQCLPKHCTSSLLEPHTCQSVRPVGLFSFVFHLSQTYFLLAKPTRLCEALYLPFVLFLCNPPLELHHCQLSSSCHTASEPPTARLLRHSVHHATLFYFPDRCVSCVMFHNTYSLGSKC